MNGNNGFVYRPFKACGLIKTANGWQTILSGDQTFYTIDAPDKWRFRERHRNEVKGINGEPFFPKESAYQKWMFGLMRFIRLFRGS